MKITVWTKIGCPWCVEVVDFLNDRHLAFEERVVTNNQAYWDEMVRISHQSKAPVVDIDGHVLIDTDADAVAAHLAKVSSK
jgi:monothiol glutaredoxin